ncbi:MAG: hypothetical protein IPI67_33680 [Myxococcales bacterium]|nr:hypothetical protein [Myxococcales bacterium]
MSRPEGAAFQRSLALHRAVVQQVVREPKLLERASRRVADWRASGAVALPYVEAWERILSLPIGALTAELLEESEAGHDRRQVSPFAGVLDPRERWQILRQLGSNPHRATG